MSQDKLPCIDCIALPVCIGKKTNNDCKKLYDYIYEESITVTRRSNRYNSIIMGSINVTKINRKHLSELEEYYESFKNSK
jgi:hypothetical protein